MSAELLLGSVFPWFVAGLLAVLIVIQLLLLPGLLGRFFKSPKLFVIFLVLAIVGGIYVRFAFVPNQHRIYYDEDRYLGYSVTFARFNKAVSIELATPQRSIIGKPDQAVRVTVPVIHGTVLKLFGYSEANLFNTSRIFSVLLAIYATILSLQLFRSYKAASITALGMFFLPIQVYWSASLALDPYFVFFCVLSMLATIAYAKKSVPIYAIQAIVSIFLLLCVRIEAFVFLPLLTYAFYHVRKTAGESFIQKKDVFFLSILLPLILFRGIASLSVLGEKWCCADSLPLEAFSLKYISRNTLPNLVYLIAGFELPYYITIPALWISLKSNLYSRRVLLYWICAFFALYTFYYAGLFITGEYSGSYARYFLILIPPLLLLFGDVLSNEITPRIRTSKRIAAVIILCTALSLYQLVSQFWQYRAMVRVTPALFDPVDKIPIEVHSYLENVLIKNTPNDALIIHPITAIALLHGRAIAYYEYFLNDIKTSNFVSDYLKQGKRVFIINAFECKALPYRCERILKTFTTKRSSLNKTGAHEFFEIHEVFLKK